MAGFLHKFIKKPSALKIITSFNNARPSNLVSPFVIHQTFLSEGKPDDPPNTIPILGSIVRDKPTDPQISQIYPSFSFDFYLNPVSPTGFDQADANETGDVGSADNQSIWADSVKKKRKRKMNKHKYNKLRKRLRLRT